MQISSILSLSFLHRPPQTDPVPSLGRIEERAGDSDQQIKGRKRRQQIRQEGGDRRLLFSSSSLPERSCFRRFCVLFYGLICIEEEEEVVSFLFRFDVRSGEKGSRYHLPSQVFLLLHRKRAVSIFAFSAERFSSGEKI